MAGNIRKTAAQSAEKWARNLRGASQSIQEGVDLVDEAPGVRAARQQNAMANNLLEAINSGKWARRVASVSLPDWKRAMKEKGIPRISQGIEGSMDKTRSALDQIIQHADRVLDTVLPMPKVTLEDSIARMSAFVRGMAELEVER